MALDGVKSWMRFYGWKDGGGPGSTKIIDGAVIARHGDATWIEDVQEACDADTREKAKAEIERRESLRQG